MRFALAALSLVIVGFVSTEAKNIRKNYGTFKPVLPESYKAKHDIKEVPEYHIVGGEDAKQGEIPFQADILSFDNQYCGGSLLNEWYVLSAAHCQKSNPTGYKVVLGEIDQNVDSGIEQTRKIAEWVKHPQYSFFTIDYDYSVIRLDEPVTLNENVAPVSLGNSRPADNTEVTVSGWGTTSAGGQISSTLKKVNVHVVNQDLCNEEYGGDITDEMICAGEPEGGLDSCQGDSGGPLFLASSQEQVGIVSWGYGCAEQGYPGVYSFVPAGLDWICQQIEMGSPVKGCP